LDNGVEKMLEVKNLMIFFENALALNDLSLEVHQGEIVSALGSNSAGKTTLMNTISGLIIDMKVKEDRRGGERITLMGEVWFEGEEILLAKPSRRIRKGIALSRERHPIFPDSDVEENLRISTYLRRDSEINKSFEFVYAIFPPLIELKKRKAGFCSGGEQQMLSIGMALMTRPKLLLLDEPLLGLSPAMQNSLIQAIKQIRKEGITVLVAEQFARPLLPIVDRGYVIENGMLALQGTGQELRENPEVRSTFMGV
jgi:branched-chain amino acid transport system ATP-binding protein